MIISSSIKNRANNSLINLLNFFSPNLSESYISLMKKLRDDVCKSVIEAQIQDFYTYHPVFTNIEIETINRCNGFCSFCPVNKNNDVRSFKVMDMSLFESIIAQLQEINYSGSLSIYSNNEPLLDKRIINFNKIARTELPSAFIYLYTNGSLLNIAKFKELMRYLDKLVIDNYNDNFELNKPVREVYDYYKDNKDLYDKVEIRIRRLNEKLTSRGGEAKNRHNIAKLKSSCLYPFKQIVIRPDGKLSLCCNDTFGKMTLGDLTRERLMDIWHGDSYSKIRKSVLAGRENVSLCKNCDTLHKYIPKY